MPRATTDSRPARVIDLERSKARHIGRQPRLETKRIALEAFLEVATAAFERGATCRSWARSKRYPPICAGLPSVDFVGPVADIRPYCWRARLALVPTSWRLQAQGPGIRVPSPSIPGMRMPAGHAWRTAQHRPVRQPRRAGEGVVSLSTISGAHARRKRLRRLRDRFTWTTSAAPRRANGGSADERVIAGSDAGQRAVSQVARLVAGK